MSRLMRLRSSQFVFLLLIACSVQIREEHALRWVEHAASGNAIRVSAPRESAALAARLTSIAKPHLSAPRDLTPAALSARRRSWTMRSPILHSTSVIAHSGLLRA